MNCKILIFTGSASPVGTVFANHSLFSIQGKLLLRIYPFVNMFFMHVLATGGVYRPNRNGTYIQIFRIQRGQLPPSPLRSREGTSDRKPKKF